MFVKKLITGNFKVVNTETEFDGVMVGSKE